MLTKILVTGATGTIGKQVVQKLRERDAQVFAAVHSPEKATDLKKMGATPVAFDYSDPSTIKAAMKGMNRLFLLTPFVENFVPMIEQTLDAAKAANVQYIVRVSAMGADAKSKSELPRQHGVADEMIAKSEIGYTILQPTFFQENLFNYQNETIEKDGAFYGAGKNGKVAYIATDDIAECATEILSIPEGHNGKTYPLTGPEALSEDEVAALVSRVLGKDVHYVDLPAGKLAEGMLSKGMPKWMVDAMVFLEGVKANGWATKTTPAVREILGQDPIRYADYLKKFKR